MFEKELEEYKNQPKWKGKIFTKDEETAFKDGMWLGYNKTNEEKIYPLDEGKSIEKSILEMVGIEKTLRYMSWQRTQLIKAKEIIKNFIDDLEVIDGEQTRELEVVKKAERFLNNEL